MPDNFDAQHLAHAQRIGRSLDFVHAFATPRQVPFDDRHVRLWTRSRRDSYVIHNWKPVARWRDAATAEAAAKIRFAARRIAALRRPVMIVLHHEPENDVTRRGVRGQGYGTPEEYRRMWRIVREAFAEAGADNTVWGAAYMNYPKWDALVPELWPGDELVDWLWFNAYGSPARPHIDENIAHFTDLAASCGIGQGLRWGVIEWSTKQMGAHGADYYRDAAAFLDTDAGKRLRAWVVFDSPGAENASGLRVAFDDHGRADPEKLEAYKAFASHPAFSCPSSTL